MTAAQPDKVIFPMPAMAVEGIAQPIAGESTLVVEALELLPDRERVIDAMNELVNGQCGRHWLLGATVEVQDPPRRELPYILGALSENDRSAGSRRQAPRGKMIQLAQLNWDDDAGIMVGDGGNFYCRHAGARPAAATLRPRRRSWSVALTSRARCWWPAVSACGAGP